MAGHSNKRVHLMSWADTSDDTPALSNNLMAWADTSDSTPASSHSLMAWADTSDNTPASSNNLMAWADTSDDSPAGSDDFMAWADTSDNSPTSSGSLMAWENTSDNTPASSKSLMAWADTSDNIPSSLPSRSPDQSMPNMITAEIHTITASSAHPIHVDMRDALELSSALGSPYAGIVAEADTRKQTTSTNQASSVTPMFAGWVRVYSQPVSEHQPQNDAQLYETAKQNLRDATERMSKVKAELAMCQARLNAFPFASRLREVMTRESLALRATIEELEHLRSEYELWNRHWKQSMERRWKHKMDEIQSSVPLGAEVQPVDDELSEDYELVK